MSVHNKPHRRLRLPRMNIHESPEGDMVHDHPEEDDYVMANSGRLGQYTSVTHSGNTKEFKDEEEAENWIRANREKEHLYTDVFFEDDHGGVELRKV